MPNNLLALSSVYPRYMKHQKFDPKPFSTKAQPKKTGT